MKQKKKEIWNKVNWESSNEIILRWLNNGPYSLAELRALISKNTIKSKHTRLN